MKVVFEKMKVLIGVVFAAGPVAARRTLGTKYFELADEEVDLDKTSFVQDNQLMRQEIKTLLETKDLRDVIRGELEHYDIEDSRNVVLDGQAESFSETNEDVAEEHFEYADNSGPSPVEELSEEADNDGNVVLDGQAKSFLETNEDVAEEHSEYADNSGTSPVEEPSEEADNDAETHESMLEEDEIMERPMFQHHHKAKKKSKPRASSSSSAQIANSAGTVLAEIPIIIS